MRRRAPLGRPVSLAGGVIAASLALGPAFAAETPAVKASVSKQEVSVGEVFAVEVKASGPPGTSWTFPERAGSDEVEVRTPRPAPGAPPPDGSAHRYEASVFALGKVELPPITVRYLLPDGGRGEVSTAAVPLRIRSVLPKDPGEQKLADIRPPLALAIGPAFWIAALALLLLLAGLAAWLLGRKRGRPPAREEAPPLSPDAEARGALARLSAAGLLARGEYRSFYIVLAEIAKRYLERRLGAPILEMTSAETVAFLRGHALGRDFAASVRDLASAADQVKFARGSGQAGEAERHLAGVGGMVDALEARLRPEPAAGAAETGARVA